MEHNLFMFSKRNDDETISLDDDNHERPFYFAYKQWPGEDVKFSLITSDFWLCSMLGVSF